MAQGWHYGGLIGKQPVTGGTDTLRTSGVRAVADAGRETGGMAEATLSGTSPETSTRGFNVSWAGASNGNTLDGSQVMIRLNGNDLYVASLSTPFDMSSTGTWSTISKPSSLPSSGYDRVCLSGDGNWVYYPQENAAVIHQFALSQPWNFSQLASSATYTTGPHTAGTNWVASNDLGDVTFSQDGTMLYVSDDGRSETYQWQLSTPWLINNMTFVRKYQRGQISATNWFPYAAFSGSTTFYRTPRSADSSGKKWFLSVSSNLNTVTHLLEGTASTAYDWSTIAWNSASKLDVTSALGFTARDFDVGPAQQVVTVSENGSAYPKNSFSVPATNKPTQRWGRQLGRSPFDGTALRNTGVITTTEAYQLQL